MLHEHLFNQSQRVPQGERSFSQLVSLPWQPDSSVTDNHWNHENNVTMAGINVTSYLPSSNIHGNIESIFKK